MSTLCRTCRTNPPAVSGLCSPCWRDHVAAQRAAQKASERARLGRCRAGRRRAPHWRPETQRGHGHGAEGIE